MVESMVGSSPVLGAEVLAVTGGDLTAFGTQIGCRASRVWTATTSRLSGMASSVSSIASRSPPMA
ncbi:hypothetical protein ATN38_03465 [Rhodococcus sp. FH8]|nr:hypothetical protein [Rhodococcus sp. FH8]